MSKDEQVDEALRQFLRAVDQYQLASAEVAASCKSGVFDIAQARKAMGGKGIGVSQIHYPARMRARATVDVKPGKDSDGCTGMHLKFRTGPAPKGEGDEEEDDPGADRDPIKWFGVLIPKHLRNSQTTFLTGLESVVCAARASVHMHEQYDRYIALKNSL